MATSWLGYKASKYVSDKTLRRKLIPFLGIGHAAQGQIPATRPSSATRSLRIRKPSSLYISNCGLGSSSRCTGSLLRYGQAFTLVRYSRSPSSCYGAVRLGCQTPQVELRNPRLRYPQNEQVWLSLEFLINC